MNAYTILDETTLETMADLAREIAFLDGALVQCGCWKGGSAAVLRCAMGPRPVWLFDSFQGMPKPKPIDGKRALWKYETIPNWHLADPDDVRAAFATAEVEFDGVIVVPGWFRDTLATAPIGAIALLHIDADWYHSTHLPLVTFYDRVQPGGVVLIDDYGYWPGCKKAVDEFRAERNITETITMINHAAGYWRKHT